MVLWALLENFSRFLAEGGFLGPADLAPFFLADLDFVLEDFGLFDFLDCCFVGLGRRPSCACGREEDGLGDDLGEFLGLDLERLRLLSLGLDISLLSLGAASLGLDLLLERLFLGDDSFLLDSFGRDLLRLLRLVWLDSRVREDRTVDFETMVLPVIDLVVPPSLTFRSRLLLSLPPPLLFCRRGGGGGGLLLRLLPDDDECFDGRFDSAMVAECGELRRTPPLISRRRFNCFNGSALCTISMNFGQQGGPQYCTV